MQKKDEKRQSRLSEVIAENRRLKNELDQLKNEIFSLVEHVHRKREYLLEISKSVSSLEKQTLKDIIDFIHRLPSEISARIRTYSELSTYEANQIRTDNNIYAILSEAYPNLSAKELKICLYLYLDRTSKEIALLLRTSESSINTQRNTIKHSLGLPKNITLKQALIEKVNALKKNKSGR